MNRVGRRKNIYKESSQQQQLLRLGGATAAQLINDRIIDGVAHPLSPPPPPQACPLPTRSPPIPHIIMDLQKKDVVTLF